MFGAYVRFKCNMQHCGSLGIISSNMCSMDSGGLSEILCEWDSQHHHKGGHWTCGIRFIRILESLTAWGILLWTVGQIWVFLCAWFFVGEATLSNVHIQGWNTTKKTMTCNFWYRHSQPLGISQLSTELSSHGSVPYLVWFYFYFDTTCINI